MATKQTILNRAENQVRQQLFGGILLAVAGLMIMTTFGLVKAVGDVTNLSFNVTAGSFTLENAPLAINFASQAFGIGNNITGDTEIDGLVATDYRGNSQAWGVTINSSNFTGDEIAASALNCYAEAGIISNLQNADTNQVAKGTNGTLDRTGITLFNGSTAASGRFNYDNGFINLTVDGTDPAGAYTATLVYTLA
ncbi:MAG: hypothetical protein WC805_03745 [Patescibacteria group bacterium]|jgi:hypothetical protein